MCSRDAVDVTGECNRAELEGSGKNKYIFFSRKIFPKHIIIKKRILFFAARIESV